MLPHAQQPDAIHTREIGDPGETFPRNIHESNSGGTASRIGICISRAQYLSFNCHYDTRRTPF